MRDALFVGLMGSAIAQAGVVNMEKKTYTVIPLAFALVAAIFFGAQPDVTHTCDIEETQRYCFDVSGGKHTRCYLTPEKDRWDYCSSGWEPVQEWVDEYTKISFSDWMIEHNPDYSDRVILTVSCDVNGEEIIIHLNEPNANIDDDIRQEIMRRTSGQIDVSDCFILESNV